MYVCVCMYVCILHTYSVCICIWLLSIVQRRDQHGPLKTTPKTTAQPVQLLRFLSAALVRDEEFSMASVSSQIPME